ncbi:MAG: helix-turn-helix domain-containing protein [Alphaproteobacteria bacterium]|nr:helix-turn-helix domain-containing protein [Alphaproteobacteria bacterium]
MNGRLKSRRLSPPIRSSTRQWMRSDAASASLKLYWYVIVSLPWSGRCAAPASAGRKWRKDCDCCRGRLCPISSCVSVLLRRPDDGCDHIPGRPTGTMTGPPDIIADPPELAGDVLSELLRVLRLTGSVFLNGHFSEPFGVISPKQWDADSPLSHLRHVSVFHLVASGGCTLTAEDGSVWELGPGDIVLMPYPVEHTFERGAHDGCVYGPDVVRDGSTAGVSEVRHGGDGPETRLVCGFIESTELIGAPLFDSLPTVLVERTADDPVAGMLASIAKEVLRQVDEARPGTEVLLGRLMETLFVEVLRRHAASLPRGTVSMLSALRDPLIARALRLLHADPARHWTVEVLARETGTSRTVLSERFNAALGKPPIEYLSGWRIQVAAERLRSTGEPLALIADAVGYDSEASFSRAFKRAMGVSPGA